jgi:hypothetical protein
MIVVNVLISAALISFCAWLARTRPDLAGFIVSLPLTTLLVLALNQTQYNDPVKGTLFAKSIFIGVPMSLLFFVPFLLAERLRLSFWTCYLTGLILLIAAFFIHKYIFAAITR